MQLSAGQWAFWDVDKPMPNGVSVFEGPFKKRRKVGELTRHQLLAYWRHSGTRGVYYSFLARDRWRDVRLIGDVGAAMEEQEVEKKISE